MFQFTAIYNKVSCHQKLRKSNIFLPILLLLISNLFIYNSITSKQYSSFFYQNEFSPAIMLACGYEFANPANKNIHMQSFLQNKTTTFECKNIDPKSLMPLNYFQGLSSYMLISAGVIWKIFGIDWDNLIPLFLLLYSMTLLAIYFIFRLGMNQYLSFLFSLLVALSSLQMYYIMQLRDYSVAPFLLWLVWIAGKLVITTSDRKKLLSFSGLAGVVLGIGLGFRVDLVVLIPFFILVLLFFVKVERNTLQNKLGGVIVFLVSFIIVGSPILSILHQHRGGALTHVIILGLADSFTTSLGLRQPETYSIIPAYRDLIPYTAINSFSQRIYGMEKLIHTATKEYSYYSNLFLLNYFYTFPADFLIRIYASIIQIPLIFIHLEKTSLQQFPQASKIHANA